MAAARLTAAQARALGIETKGKARVRRTAAARYHSRCVTCGEEFSTEKAEERHLIEAKHARYEMVTDDQ